MRFLALSTFLLCFSASLLADVNNPAPQPQAIANQQTTVSQDQQWWFANQLIAVNKQIATIDAQLSRGIANSATLDDLKNELTKVKSAQVKLTTQFEQIDIDNNKQYQAQNNRISDISSNTNIWGFIFTTLGILVVVSTIGIGYFARKDAIQAAENKVLEWIENRKGEIVNSLVAKTEPRIEAVVKQASTQLDEHISDAKNSSKELAELSDEYKVLIQNADNEFRKKMAELGKDKDEKDIQKFKQKTEQNLASKSEEKYSPSDWFDKALTAYYSESYDDSIEFFEKVINDSNSSEELIGQALNNQGLALRKLGQAEKAIAVYENLVSRFGDSDELALQEQVASALVNQGGALGKLGQAEKAIAVSENAVSRFGDSDELALQELIAMALGNTVEFSLLCEDKQSTQNRIERAENAANIDPLNFAVMQFMRFLINELSLENLIEQLEKLPSDTEFRWGFDEIRSYLDELTGDKKWQANAIADFFENHHDIGELKKQLAD